jgi:hypothetical protein
LFDNDINPEGANLRITGGAGPLTLFANGGVYVIDENSAHSDPKMLGGQLGGALKVADHVSLGARGSLYHFFALDDAFFLRAACDNNSRAGCAMIRAARAATSSTACRAGTARSRSRDGPRSSPRRTRWSRSSTGLVQNFSARQSLVAAREREDDAGRRIFVGDR